MRVACNSPLFSLVTADMYCFVKSKAAAVFRSLYLFLSLVPPIFTATLFYSLYLLGLAMTFSEHLKGFGVALACVRQHSLNRV